VAMFAYKVLGVFIQTFSFLLVLPLHIFYGSTRLLLQKRIFRDLVFRRISVDRSDEATSLWQKLNRHRLLSSAQD